ncbi:MAG: toxin-antitoxin system YwqK family antitoxin [Thiomargarita sp.]|nr:toxin-antitoxin system YwqK family antitoxin [Thiomargarita sp.]
MFTVKQIMYIQLKIVLFFFIAIIFALITVISQATEELEQFYESGALHFDHTAYRNSKLHGLSKEYYESGEPKAEILYKSGRITAKKEFSRNGDLEYELKYEDSKKLETQIEYYPTGEPFRRRSLINNMREGLEIEFYRDGQTKAERNYVNGKKEGNARGYHINGKLQGDWIFKNGEPIMATLFYSSGGKWLLHTSFDQKGRLNGVSKEYDKKEGKLMALRYYKRNDMVKRRRVSSWLRWWWELIY